jgi:hypothetical protein
MSLQPKYQFLVIIKIWSTSLLASLKLRLSLQTVQKELLQHLQSDFPVADGGMLEV